MKVAVIGLDCAAPRLVFERYREHLPHLKALMERGCFGPLESTHPPITVPAWACMMRSQDPGQLGIYGFRNRKDHSYDGLSMANASVLKSDALWDLLGRAGKNVIVLGVPPSFPPKPVNGVQVGCFLTPSTGSTYTYPPDLRAEIDRVAPGYVVDVEGFRTDDKDALLKRIYDKTRKHFAVAKHLVKTRPWDFFMMVEMGVDRIHHSFWKFMDPDHPKYERGNPFENAIRDYYRYCDQEIGELQSLFPPGTAVLVVSDHGAKKLKTEIDWSRTKAWGDGGYYGRLFMNVKGREPLGTIDPHDYDRVRNDLIAEIEGIEDPSGRNIGTKAHRPEDLYREVRNVAPDLTCYFGNLDWRSIGSVGLKGIHTFENDTGPDDANHDWHGIFILSGGADGRPRGELRGLRIYDVAPTVLGLYGLEPPAGMLGKGLC
ncbi:MAG: phosphodiesterase [Acidobacteria bacterium]|nr:MAG: phosphodiesterase [Acidobacteriota bacterium]